MNSRHPNDARARQRRERVAQETARLIASGEQSDPERARRKAASRLGIRHQSELPDGAEIHGALLEHRRLFGSGMSEDRLAVLRSAALEAMVFLQAFEPRLAGPVLAGAVTGTTPVTLHLHASAPDDVARFLHDQRIPADQRLRRLRLGADASTELPCWELLADGVAFELIVLPASSLREPPRDAMDGRPMPRASAAALRRLTALQGPGSA